MRRREFIGLLGGAATAASGAWPAPVRAQGKIPRIGYFWNDFPDPNVGLAGLRQGLQERGYVLGRNLLLDERYAEGDPSRTRDLITELLALGVDVLVTGDFALIQAHTLQQQQGQKELLEMNEAKSKLPIKIGGTEITRFNALRHGVLSRYTVLPWEDAAEYRDLVAALVAEHAPQGPTEEHLVEELAGILWRQAPPAPGRGRRPTART